MTKGRIALFAPSMTGGGAERIFATLAGGFAHRGWRTDLVLARAEGPYLADLDPAVRVVDLGARRVLRAVLPLRDYVRRERPDVVLATIVSANAAALVASALPGTGMRLIVRESTTPSVAIRSSGSIRQRLSPYFFRALKGHIARAVAPSAGAAEDLARCYGLGRSRVEVIPNPVVTPSLLDLASESVSHPWLEDPRLQVVIAVGRLSPPKNYPLLMEAFASLPEPGTKRLVILGEGPLRGELKGLAVRLGIADRLDIPGFVDNPFAYMAGSDVFVLSSDREGLPAALIQALACGCPAVSTDCPSGPIEILEGGRHGRLVPVGDRDAMVRAITAVLAGEGPVPDLGSVARYDSEHALDLYEQLVVDVIEGRPARRNERENDE